ncbi:MAG: hypothetical protein QME81_05455 [bacterium]|nr:hypothetical protein [bacterium]
MSVGCSDATLFTTNTEALIIVSATQVENGKSENGKYLDLLPISHFLLPIFKWPKRWTSPTRTTDTNTVLAKALRNIEKIEYPLPER